MVTQKIEMYLGQVDPDGFDAVQDFTAPFPVHVITTMFGVPDEQVDWIRHWVDESLHREVGQLEVGEKGMQANVEMRCSITTWWRSGAPTRKTTS